MNTRELITNISSSATLVPILAGILAFKSSNNTQRFFLLYLCLGFSIDFIQIFVKEGIIQTSIYNLYAVTEIFFVVWFIWKLSVNNAARKAYLVILYAIVPLWILCHFAENWQLTSIGDYSKWFDGSVAIIIASMTAFEILEIIQKHDNKSFQLPELWFQSALFLYFFCTFFIFFLMEAPIRTQIWFIHNLVNVAECFLLSVAYYIIYKSRHKKMVGYD